MFEIEIEGRKKQREGEKCVRKFFTSCTQTPGGTVKINREKHKIEILQRDLILENPSSGKVEVNVLKELFLPPISTRNSGE